jgi:hypothetical protein
MECWSIGIIASEDERQKVITKTPLFAKAAEGQEKVRKHKKTGHGGMEERKAQRGRSAVSPVPPSLVFSERVISD